MLKKIKMQIEAASSLNVQALALIILAVHPESQYDSSLKLPIKVGSGDAAMLCNQLGKQSLRPTTHTLISRIIEELGAEVASICISKVEGSLFFADVTIIDNQGVSHTIDSRPSDALSIAATVQCPIYCTEEVLLTAGMPDFRDIKDIYDSDKAISDLVERDLSNELQLSKNPSIEEAVVEKLELLQRLNILDDDESDNINSDSFDDEDDESKHKNNQ